MKKQFLTVGLGVAAVAVAIGILVHSLLSTRQSALSQDKAPTMASDPLPGVKPPKVELQPQDLPAEYEAAVKAVLPDARIEAVKGKPGKYKLKLAWAGKTGSAKLAMAGQQVTGSVSEDLPVSEMPAVIAEAFKNAVPEGKIDRFAKATLVGGKRDGTMVYQWDWGNNCDGEASLDGKQITMSDEIASSQLPPVVSEAVAKAFPQASMDKKVRRVIDNGRIRYECDLKPADGSKKVRVTASATGELSWK